MIRHCCTIILCVNDKLLSQYVDPARSRLLVDPSNQPYISHENIIYSLSMQNKHELVYKMLIKLKLS